MSRTPKISIFALVCVSFLLFSCEKQGVEKDPGKVVIPEAVDLGLSVKWASFDVGATKPGEVGYFVSWGEIAPKDTYYKWENYLWCNIYRENLTKYNYDPAYGSILDYRIALKAEDDIAHVLYGGDWHVPTVDEFKELIESPFITLSVETVGTVDCLKVTSTKTGNSILLPAGGKCEKTITPPQMVYPMKSGNFWSAEIDYTQYSFQYEYHHPYNAFYLQASPKIGSNFVSMSLWETDRAYGMNVRAVCGGDHF